VEPIWYRYLEKGFPWESTTVAAECDAGLLVTIKSEIGLNLGNDLRGLLTAGYRISSEDCHWVGGIRTLTVGDALETKGMAPMVQSIEFRHFASDCIALRYAPTLEHLETEQYEWKLMIGDEHLDIEPIDDGFRIRRPDYHVLLEVWKHHFDGGVLAKGAMSPKIQDVEDWPLLLAFAYAKWLR